MYLFLNLQILPAADCFQFLLIIFCFKTLGYYKPDVPIGPKNVHLLTARCRENEISRADCRITLSVPFILGHVSPRAGSKVSVAVTGDRTVCVWLGTEPQR